VRASNRARRRVGGGASTAHTIAVLPVLSRRQGLSSRLAQRPAHPVPFPGLLSPAELRESGKSRNRSGRSATACRQVLAKIRNGVACQWTPRSASCGSAGAATQVAQLCAGHRRNACRPSHI
jgi:hypothetical protein